MFICMIKTDFTVGAFLIACVRVGGTSTPPLSFSACLGATTTIKATTSRTSISRNSYSKYFTNSNNKHQTQKHCNHKDTYHSDPHRGTRRLLSHVVAGCFVPHRRAVEAFLNYMQEACFASGGCVDIVTASPRDWMGLGGGVPVISWGANVCAALLRASVDLW